MNTASQIVPEKPATTGTPAAAAPAASVDFSKPVVKPKKSVFKLFGEVLDHGGPGYLQFAISNLCKAECDFCGIARSKFRPQAPPSVHPKETQDGIDNALKNHIGYLLFVGGEP